MIRGKNSTFFDLVIFQSHGYRTKCLMIFTISLFEEIPIIQLRDDQLRCWPYFYAKFDGAGV